MVSKKVYLNTNGRLKVMGKLVVRLTTSCWYGARGDASYKKTLTAMKKLSDFSIRDLIDDLSFNEPINLYEVEDGLYEMISVNESSDWETGCIDDFDIKLIPYQENIKNV